MTDFIFELSQKQGHPTYCPKEQWWTLYIDGASKVFGSRVGLILQSPIGKLMEQFICLNFSASNNKAEYEAVIVGLNLALMLVATKLEIKSDSQLIVGKIQQEYEAKDERMARYLVMVEDHLKKLNEWVVRRVPRKENVRQIHWPE